jgi:transposase
MDQVSNRVRNEVKAMTRLEVMRKAQEGRITWLQAAEILRLTARQVRRIRERYDLYGETALADGRAGRKQTNRRINTELVERVCRLKREEYEDFSIRHFHEQLEKHHGIRLGYTSVKTLLHLHGIVEKQAHRGVYRRRRERSPLRGLLVHLDASTHEWVPGCSWDLNVMLDDADGAHSLRRVCGARGCDVDVDGARGCGAAVGAVCPAVHRPRESFLPHVACWRGA